MRCERCGKEFEVLFNSNQNNLHLCSDCSESENVKTISADSVYNLIDSISFFEDETYQLDNDENSSELVCEKCGLTHNDLLDTGFVGCSECYNVFSKTIENMCLNFHGQTTHKKDLEARYD